MVLRSFEFLRFWACHEPAVYSFSVNKVGDESYSDAECMRRQPSGVGKENSNGKATFYLLFQTLYHHQAFQDNAVDFQKQFGK